MRRLARSARTFLPAQLSMAQLRESAAGCTGCDLYKCVTNAVKHFKWEPQGKRRKHKKPSATEIAACRPWLEAEIAVVKPRVIICLGVTAAQAAFGKAVRLNELRGRPWSTSIAPIVFVTVHPSAVLRHPDPVEREREYRGFVEDLRSIWLHLQLKAA